MCGIFGIISSVIKDHDIAKLIRQGLERLEYRGYDSAGIALVHKGHIELRKKPGRIADINADGIVDMRDLSLVAMYLGAT